MAESSAVASTAVASSVPTSGAPPAEGQGRSTEQTKPASKAKSEVGNVTGEGETRAAEAAPPPDEEYDIDGEKITKSKLFEEFKRRKEFERASHKRMQEGAEARKAAAAREAQIEEAFSRLSEDPYAVYRARGMSDEQIDQIAENRLMQRMKRAQMTPEQIEAEQLRSEYQKTRAELDKIKAAQQKAQSSALEQKYVEHFDQQIAKAMEIGNLARTASTGAKVAAVMAEYLQADEQIEPALAAQIVRDNHHTESRHEFTELRQQLTAGRITPAKFMAYVTDLIGADTVKEIRLSAVKEAQDFEPQKPKGTPKAPPLPKKSFDSFEEANAWIGQRTKK